MMLDDALVESQRKTSSTQIPPPPTIGRTPILRIIPWSAVAIHGITLNISTSLIALLAAPPLCSLI
jgi:hypothetical protein